MTRILLITHGDLGKVFVEVAQGILKKSVAIDLLSFQEEQSQEEFSKALQKMIEHYPQEDQILILTDLFGGTPSNLAIPYLEKNRIEVITGLNLAMLLHLVAGCNTKSFIELCQGARKAGLDSVVRAGDFL